MFDPEIEATVAQLADALRSRGEKLVTAESCTGGLIAAACTSIAGSSDWFERGFVTYSNEAKAEMLGVDAELIARHGAVSEKVVHAMVLGALERSRATWSIAVSGVAGPGGGTVTKPVGLVWTAWAGPSGVDVEAKTWPGDRGAVRRASVQHALAHVVAMVGLRKNDARV
jgi:nicotinamide-nucleotide amidase